MSAGHERALQAALASFAQDHSAVANALRHEFKARLAKEAPDGGANRMQLTHAETRRAALRAAREAILAMRANDEIGDDAFHQVEEDLDWLEMAGRSADA